MWNGDMRLWEANSESTTSIVMAASLKDAKYLCKAHERVPPLKKLQFKELLLTPTVIYASDLVHDLAYEPTKEATG